MIFRHSLVHLLRMIDKVYLEPREIMDYREIEDSENWKEKIYQMVVQGPKAFTPGIIISALTVDSNSV